MPRRYFEHLHSEISVAAGRRVSRYDLWLTLLNGGLDPEDLNREQVRIFLDEDLDGFLHEEGATLRPRTRQRLEKSLLRFSPRNPTPAEWLTRLLERAA